MKPLLAEKAQLQDLKYPLLLSPKLDGIRAIIKDGKVLTRALKEVPNEHIQKTFGKKEYEGMDGEFILGDPTAPDVYRKTNSACMTIKGEPDITYWLFDRYNVDAPFIRRYKTLIRNVGANMKMVPHYPVSNEEELLALEHKIVTAGYEGIMLRDPVGKYKFGRSTLREGILLKLKRFSDAEAEIIDFQELMHNGNEAVINELGYMDHSNHKANMVPMGVLGAFICRTPEGIQFKIGTGLTADQRKNYWEGRANLLGKLVKYKYFEVGVKDAPRHPVFIGFREVIDL